VVDPKGSVWVIAELRKDKFYGTLDLVTRGAGRFDLEEAEGNQL
jgi:hypothetical protein